MRQQTFRFALIGCGHMGATADDRAASWAGAAWTLPLSHGSAIQATEGAELVAVCDVREEAARAAGQRFGVPAVYTDFRKMLAEQSPDGVAIATRTRERREIIEASLEAGVRAFFCEKPLCHTLEIADGLCRRLAASGAFFVYGTRRRYMPIYQHARAEIASGRIGEVQTILVRFGKAPLLWTHPHSVDIASYFAGDPDVEFVQAELEVDVAAIMPERIDADPLVRAGYIGFRNGVRAHVLASDSFDVEVIGSDGMLTVALNGAALEWQLRPSAGGPVDAGYRTREREENRWLSSATVRGFEALVAALRGGAANVYAPALALRNQEVLFGFVYSHLEGGRRIALPLERRGLEITGRLGDRYP